MIFQEPATALDPTFTIGHQIAETVRAHEGATWEAARRRALDLLELVQVPSAARRLQAYPHEAVRRPAAARDDRARPVVPAEGPDRRRADHRARRHGADPGPAPPARAAAGARNGDPVRDARRRRRLRDRRRGRRHVRRADRRAAARTEEVLGRPGHPYARGLLRSVVTSELVGTRLEPIKGSPPDLSALPPGCSFAPRLRPRDRALHRRDAPLAPISPTHLVRCMRSGEARTRVAGPAAEETVPMTQDDICYLRRRRRLDALSRTASSRRATSSRRRSRASPRWIR